MIPKDLLSSFPRFLYFSRGAITSRLARLCGKAEGRGMSWSWVAREYCSFTPGPLSPWDKKTETWHDPGLPSPKVHGGSLSRKESDCQALCREWSRASRRRCDIAVRPLPVKRQTSPRRKAALSRLEDCPLPAGRQPSPLGRGCPATALSPAVAGRVRGSFPVSQQERIQMANGKWQNSNGLRFADFSNPKPFAI